MLSTPNALATSTGSGVSFAYFKTDVVGLTARFCSEVNRLMMASVIPMAQLSLVVAEMSWKGRTAMVSGAAFNTTLFCCEERAEYVRHATKPSTATISAAAAPIQIFRDLPGNGPPVSADVSLRCRDSESRLIRFRSAFNSAADW